MYNKVILSLLMTGSLLMGGSSLAILNITTPEVLSDVKVTHPRYIGKDLSNNEKEALKTLQDRGITDRMALAVILGNIKQESKFHPNICEGGARINYEKCLRGGYGLIQWTTSFRYFGLGNHAKDLGMNPSTLEAQLSYIFTEPEWQKAEKMFKKPGQPLSYYMSAARIWLGWGVYGNRGFYSQQYYNTLTLVDMPVEDT